MSSKNVFPPGLLSLQTTLLHSILAVFYAGKNYLNCILTWDMPKCCCHFFFRPFLEDGEGGIFLGKCQFPFIKILTQRVCWIHWTMHHTKLHSVSEVTKYCFSTDIFKKFPIPHIFLFAQCIMCSCPEVTKCDLMTPKFHKIENYFSSATITIVTLATLC